MNTSTSISLYQIKAMTNNFSDDQIIGHGGHGLIYKAVHNGEEIAVKRFRYIPGLDNEEFQSEFRAVTKVSHRNFARLICYCHETRHEFVECKGQVVSVEATERVLCFEYMQGGSVDKYIEEESCGLDWPTCYKIIKETCDGLNHIHNALETPIFHLDLKPAKILLDKNMTPKIIGFGCSTIDSKEEECDFYARRKKEEAHYTHMHEWGSSRSTLGYMAPEYISAGIISKKVDVFSLGVIVIKMVSGNIGYSRCSEAPPEQFIELVSENWKVRLQAMSEDSSHEIDILRVRTCVEIALKCVEANPNKRPSIEDIVHELEELEAEIKVIMLLPLIFQSGYRSALPLQFLKDITKNFSDENLLGSGGFGVVYKGLVHNGAMVAVKKLLQAIPSSQKQFENEVNLLIKLRHKNIVRLLGYCYEIQHIHTHHEGRPIFAENRPERLLCLECLPNGSLENYISDASSKLDWHTRCKIIEGISYGLQYLHGYSKDPIIHLDLKPANILLDENMLPKITDFGLSRLFDQNKTIHSAARGTLGYMAPELLRGIITPSADIFSLGVVIMEVITGHRDYPYDIRESSESFVELELQKWKTRLQREPGCTSLETDCQQIERCLQIGLICVNLERKRRPTMQKIIDMLEGRESMNWYIRNELMSPADHVR